MHNPDREFEPKIGVPEEQAPEITAEEKEKKDIEAIENIDFLGDQDKMELILTYLGEKPSSIVEIDYNEKKSIVSEDEFLQAKDDLKKLFEECGLEFSILESKGVDYSDDCFERRGFTFFIGRNKDAIEKLKEARLWKNIKEEGLLLGYPESACKAFSEAMRDGNSKKLLEKKELWKKLSLEEKKEFIEKGLFHFQNFRFSEDNWEEELKTVKKWQEIIREKSPKLYRDMIKDKPKFAMSKKERADSKKEEIERFLGEIRKRVEKIKDSLGEPIDEEIKETVVLFNAFNLRTYQSCGGHIKGEREDREENSAPWIMVYPKEPTIEGWQNNEKLKEGVLKKESFFRKKTTALLDLFYKERKVSEDVKLELKGIGYGFKIQSQGAEDLETTQSDGTAEKVQQYRKEIEEFTSFLNNLLPDYLEEKLKI